MYKVVYLLIPTSNHNLWQATAIRPWLYIFWFLHQTTTETNPVVPKVTLYIFWFLHQTTTRCRRIVVRLCCISFDSYIKPQLQAFLQVFFVSCISFDSYIKPQPFIYDVNPWEVVYLLIPTSNHNFHALCVCFSLVVYLLIPTSNHNLRLWIRDKHLLYIFWFLHQTTTTFVIYKFRNGCISFDSYIKPQLRQDNCRTEGVVYLLIPTSNHNLILEITADFELYIFWFLHQTTTGGLLSTFW